MISRYTWVLDKSTAANALAQIDFSSFLRQSIAEFRRNENAGAGHLKPQVRFVGEKVTKIFKYEAGLDSIIRRVLEDIGFNPQGELKLPVVNESKPRNIVPSDEDIGLIREVYAEDFEAFGY